MWRRSGFGSASIALILSVAGCAMCENCDDHAYSAYGGRWQRTDRYHGRVGSLYDMAGAPTAACSDEDGSVLEVAEPMPDQNHWMDEEGLELSPAVPTPAELAPTPY